VRYPARVWRWVWVVAVAGCVRCVSVDAPIERVVDAPITIDEVRARAKPPEVIADIESETVHVVPDKAGAGACHAAAVCALVLVLELLPKRDQPYDVVYQRATIRDRGVLTYEAVFENSAFQGAWLRDEKRARLVNTITAAGKQRLVEIGSAPIGPDGKPGELTRSPLLPQVDLGPVYLAQLIADQQHGEHEPGGVGERFAKAEAKAQLTIAEMARVLTPEEGAALARAWQAEPRLNAKVKELLRHQLLHDWQ
jgi:hypothetical protein